MRRTTICRSSAVIAAALLTAAAAAATAQNPPAQPQQPRAEVTTGPQQVRAGAVPTTHTVAQGETLWALAQRYFGDPMLWPELYRLNTDVVEDPHWIYPGEELRLVAQDTAQAAVAPQGYVAAPGGEAAAPAQQPTGPVSPTTGPTVFSQAPARGRSADAVEARTARAYRAVRDGEYYASGFLTEGQELPAVTIGANAQTAVLRGIRTRTSAQVYDNLLLTAVPPGDSLAVGDLLLTYRLEDEVPGYGRIVHPTGLLRFTGYSGVRPVATVVRMFTTVEDGQQVIRVAPFTFSSSQRPVAVTDGVTGQVIRLRDGERMAMHQGVLFIDKGADDGVRLGDVFQIVRLTEDRANPGQFFQQDQARVIIVNTRSKSATGVIVELYRGDITPGCTARQIARMPS